jgi:DMSO/TMAO reductase YedYZ heme-binding membrane subunit
MEIKNIILRFITGVSHFVKALIRCIFSGKIPGRAYLQRFILILAALTPLVWYFPHVWEDLGENAWQILVVIMLLRPLSQVFPRLKIFMALVPFRKELGILCASMVLAHGAGFYIANDLPIVSSFFDFTYWTFDDNQGYAHVAGLVAVPLLLTSNRWSQVLLKRNWKRIQYLAYVFFLAGGLHTVLIFNDDWIFYVVEMITVIGFWVLAHYKIVLWKKLSS